MLWNSKHKWRTFSLQNINNQLAFDKEKIIWLIEDFKDFHLILISRARLLIAIRTEITDNVEILPEKNGKDNKLTGFL